MRPPAVWTNVAFASVYAVVFLTCYVLFLNYYFDYAGYTWYDRDPSFLVWSVAISIAPIICYRGVRGLSSVLAVFVFVLLYVPIILTFSLGADYPASILIAFQLVFMLSMSLLFLADVIIVRNPLDFRGQTDLMPWMLLLTVAATCYMGIVYRSNLRFVGFGEALYEQRFANVELGAGLVTRYLSSWLSNVLVPLCLAFGLIERRRVYFVAGVVACVVLYMATAAKAAILLPPVYAAFFILLGRDRLSTFFPVFVGVLCLLIVVLLGVTRSTEGVTFLVSSILIMRTIGNGGQLTMTYFDFFSSHPQTAYTHINLVRSLTGSSPYGGRTVGEVVGQYYFGIETNANANFWATDGIAASGLPGVALISVVAAVLFVVLNSVTRAYDRLFVVLCFLPFLLYFLNTSLFSAVWSGGAFFLMIFFLCNRPRGRFYTRGITGAARAGSSSGQPTPAMGS